MHVIRLYVLINSDSDLQKDGSVLALILPHDAKLRIRFPAFFTTIIFMLDSFC